MVTREVEGAYQGALRAFHNPMLALLHQTHAPFVVTVLSMVFTAERPAVVVADTHTEINDALDQLRATGDADEESPSLPTGNARDLCRQWVQAGWLMRQVSDDDVEVYRLSAYGVGALEIAGRVGGVRTRVSQSRVRTLLEAIERLARDADPDAEARMGRLRAEIEERQRELARLEAGGTVETADDEQLLESAENVLHLARELPADFARVAESIKAVQRDVVAELRHDVRPTGEVLREYLDHGRRILDAMPEGRAFAGALRLIGDPDQIDDMWGQLRTVLRHRFADQLPEPQRRELTEISRRIEQGVIEVLTAQRQASHVITSQVRNHDPMRDRQVDELLRAVMSSLHKWVPGSRRGETVDPVRRLPVADVGHLRQRTSDLQPPRSPAPLHEWDDDDDVTGADTRAWGGPRYADLRAHLAAFAGEAGSVDVTAAFQAAAEDLRRPVDLLGLLEVADGAGMTETGEVTTVDTVRPDRTRRRFALGATMTANPATTDRSGSDE
ncbi:DUF3375 domain-containing protein [Actinoplanes bogorensis]|uniref:DUF3375 domain-containing protein n=1 Tax=Paractinoplanes bogorensis TaxID=1610840 RepID=A0ABS5YX12_9ACTN|nr:DUF3375 domain-containing protein [Actinoplanes bogorensis]MBU2667249.1 DUF3375 domain-containing protein [Actinoplanes bogorensis]